MLSHSQILVLSNLESNKQFKNNCQYTARIIHKQLFTAEYKHDRRCEELHRERGGQLSWRHDQVSFIEGEEGSRVSDHKSLGLRHEFGFNHLPIAQF